MKDGFVKDNFPFSYVILNSSLEIVNINEVFEAEFNAKYAVEDKLKITDLIENFNTEVKNQKAIIRKKCYSVYTSKFEISGDCFFNVFFIENNCEKNRDCDINNIIVSLIFIDNYEEILDTMEEVRHPLLLAIVDRKINKMAHDLCGIVRKFEKDKYIFIFSKDKLEHLKETKFPILDAIREIDMGNTLPVTLSIGIGINGSSLSQTMEFARAAIDLALSRGGDQVLMKDNEKYYFFGGHSKEIGANNRVRARVKAYALNELIEEASNVVIMGHKNSDLDCFGAALGVFSIVASLQKSCNIVLNKVTSSISTLYKRVVDESKYFGVIIDGTEAANIINDKTLLIIVDTHIPSICETPELIKIAKKIVIFDHHRKSTEFIENAVLTYHEPYASSTCELITEMLLYMNRSIKLSCVVADALLAGITVDTKNFALKTGTKTFEAAAYLRRNGADTVRVRTLFKSSLELYMAKAETVAGAEIFNGNMAIATLTCPAENPILLAAQAADELLNISNIEASFVLCKLGKVISISARSLEGINVQVIMEKLGGGGHLSVAAAQIEKDDFSEAINMLKHSIYEYLEISS